MHRPTNGVQWGEKESVTKKEKTGRRKMKITGTKELAGGLKKTNGMIQNVLKKGWGGLRRSSEGSLERIQFVQKTES